ncbi:MAG TPA: FKBP-type peptidyl-prolyl cis-trans isomerase [Ilumatobacteraceae bacterium]
MGTQKRERQKANRQQRLIEEARVERSSKVKRNVVRWTLAAVAAFGAVLLIAWIGGAFDGDDEDATEPLVTAPIETLTTVTTPVDTAPVDTTPAVTTPPGGTTPADAATGKPSVAVPEELPTTLVITDIEVGEGDPAEEGDTLEVKYVGVRSANGEEFDNNYDAGTTFPVTLGAGGVIEGWEQGLIGMQAGGMRQIDIPAELAYGDQARGDVIQAGDSLSFVVEVESITPGESE